MKTLLLLGPSIWSRKGTAEAREALSLGISGQLMGDTFWKVPKSVDVSEELTGHLHHHLGENLVETQSR